MHNIFKSHHPKRHVRSFKYAFEGLFHALINEANFRVQIVYTLFIVIIGLFLGLTTTEWALMVLATGILLMAEMVNTVVEEFIDNLIKEQSQVAKIIKDLAAGFVLTAAITTLIVSLLIFLPKIIELG